MQNWLCVWLKLKIAASQSELHIDQRNRSGGGGGRDGSGVFRIVDERRYEQYNRRYEERLRRNPGDSASEECAQAECIVGKLLDNNGGDEEPRDDEEHVDTNKAPRKQPGA